MDNVTTVALDAINTILKHGDSPTVTLADIHRLTSDVVSLINKAERIKFALYDVTNGGSKSYCEARYPKRFKS